MRNCAVRLANSTTMIQQPWCLVQISVAENIAVRTMDTCAVMGVYCGSVFFSANARKLSNHPPSAVITPSYKDWVSMLMYKVES